MLEKMDGIQSHIRTVPETVIWMDILTWPEDHALQASFHVGRRPGGFRRSRARPLGVVDGLDTFMQYTVNLKSPWIFDE